MRMAHALLRSNHYVPEEVEMLKEIARLKDEISQSTDEKKKTELARILQKKTLALTIALEKYKKKR